MKLLDLMEFIQEELYFYGEDVKVVNLEVKDNIIKYSISFVNDEGEIKIHENECHYR